MHRGDRIGIQWVAWCAVLILGAGCGWLETRDPLEGEVLPPVPWESPVDPETVLANMDSALIYLGRGIDNYARCLGDTFHFYPFGPDADALAQQGNENAFLDWDRDIEQEVMNLVLSGATSVDLTFVDEDHQEVAGTEEFKIWDEHYILVITKQGGEEETHEGIAHLELRIDPDQANQWFITRWQDFEWPGQTTSTWGLLRGETRQI